MAGPTCRALLGSQLDRDRIKPGGAHLQDGFCTSSEHADSGRAAVIADEGESVWLYLTQPGGDEIAA